MPFDPVGYVQTKPDLSKPSLEGLAWLLRHPEEWSSHIWDYRSTDAKYWRANEYADHCGTAGCAIGLAREVWDWARCDKAGLNLGSKDSWQQRIFNRHSFGEEITAEIVAGRIDDYLAHRPIRKMVAGDMTK